MTVKSLIRFGNASTLNDKGSTDLSGFYRLYPGLLGMGAWRTVAPPTVQDEVKEKISQKLWQTS